MALQKFVVLIVVLMMITGLTVYVALDSEIFESDPEPITSQNIMSNTINNK